MTEIKLSLKVIRAVVFDFDGVLTESVDIKTRAYARLFKEEGEEARRLEALASKSIEELID